MQAHYLLLDSCSILLHFHHLLCKSIFLLLLGELHVEQLLHLVHYLLHLGLQFLSVLRHSAIGILLVRNRSGDGRNRDRCSLRLFLLFLILRWYFRALHYLCKFEFWIWFVLKQTLSNNAKGTCLGNWISSPDSSSFNSLKLFRISCTWRGQLIFIFGLCSLKLRLKISLYNSLKLIEKCLWFLLCRFVIYCFLFDLLFVSLVSHIFSQLLSWINCHRILHLLGIIHAVKSV